MKIIAELCQNHNGDFEILKDMVCAAYESGADYVKIQTIFADMLAYRERFETGLEVKGVVKVIKRPFQDEYNRLTKLELSYEQQADFVEYCTKIGIKPLTTVFNRLSIQKIIEVGFKNIKIPSYDCGSIPLLEDVRPNFNNIFISTGATYDNEIEMAVNVLNRNNFSFLHCVTIYPTPLNQFHLSRMEYLRHFTNKVGWSDHSLVSRDGINGTLAAIYYGADIIERHFTILDADKTKDGPVSILPKHLKKLKYFSNLKKYEQKKYLKQKYPNFEQTLGQQSRKLSDAELLNRDYFRGRFANIYSNNKIIYNWE